MIPDQAIAAGLAAWGQCSVGVGPKRQMTNILEAAAPFMPSLSAAEIEAVGAMVKAAKAMALEEAADAVDADPYDDLDPFYAGWLRDRARKIREEA